MQRDVIQIDVQAVPGAVGFRLTMAPLVPGQPPDTIEFGMPWANAGALGGQISACAGSASAQEVAKSQFSLPDLSRFKNGGS